MVFRTRPDDFIEGADIVACYVQYGDEFVLLHRLPHKSNGDKWGLPAGKVESSETASEAMHREIQEETGIDIPTEELSYFDSVFVRHEGRDFRYHMFSAVLPIRPEIHLDSGEHKDYKWVTARDSLAMDLVLDLDTCTKLFYQLQ